MTTLESHLAVLIKTKYMHPLRPSNSTLKHMPKKKVCMLQKSCIKCS